jgi:hypothetical protein
MTDRPVMLAPLRRVGRLVCCGQAILPSFLLPEAGIPRHTVDGVSALDSAPSAGGNEAGDSLPRAASASPEMIGQSRAPLSEFPCPPLGRSAAGHDHFVDITKKVDPASRPAGIVTGGYSFTGDRRRGSWFATRRRSY